MSQVRFGPGHQIRALRQVYRLQQLSELQAYRITEQAQGYRGTVPGVQAGYDPRAPLTLRQDLLLLRALSGLQIRHLEHADPRALPEVQLAAHDGEDHQAPRHRTRMPAGELQVYRTGRTPGSGAHA